MKKNEQKNLSLGYLKLSEVLKLLPISKSTWYRNVKAGKCPKPCKFGKSSLYRREDIEGLLAQISAGAIN